MELPALPLSKSSLQSCTEWVTYIYIYMYAQVVLSHHLTATQYTSELRSWPEKFSPLRKNPVSSFLCVIINLFMFGMRQDVLSISKVNLYYSCATVLSMQIDNSLWADTWVNFTIPPLNSLHSFNQQSQSTVVTIENQGSLTHKCWG